MFFDDDEKLETTENVEETEEEVSAETEQELETLEDGIVAGLEDIDAVPLVQQSFLDYAMSVIVARAIPDVRDGMKPVHRRIVYSMSESGNTPDKPFKKCARIVGDVMGKYHPHGDAAIYGALVRLAQPFAMRYTLVEGHGNFGSIDGDEPAAYRYTEARMAKLALQMVRDIDCNTVDFMDNYDGVDQEPTVLPSRFPNLLVNGSNGIAVGMATNMPPHNLGEVIDGITAIAHNPEITNEELMNYVHGPDFPGGAIILGKGGIREAYETGTGSIAIRSRCHIEDRGEHGGLKQIIVDEIPYQVNKANMIEKMASLVKDKIIDGITEIRDESSKEGIRVVIEVRRDVIPEVILNQLYKNTQLQTSFGIINLCLVNGAPKVLPLNAILQNYLDFQRNVIARRTQFLYEKDKARDHIVVGLIKCHDNIDEIVEIIKNSASQEAATEKLMSKFDFSKEQVDAILSMQLRRLTGIETDKLEAERKQLEDNIAEYTRILSSQENITEVVLNELDEIKRKFGDDRRTEISNDASTIDDEDLIPEEDIVVALTKGGYIKRLTSDTFKTQHRGGRGIRGMSTNENDDIDLLLLTKTHTDVLFFTDYGKVYRIRGYMIPEFNRNSKGIPVINLINIEKGENVKAIIAVDDKEDKEILANRYLMFFTREGVVKRTPLTEFESIRTNGKIAITLREGDTLIDVKQIEDDTIIGIAANNSKMVNFRAPEVRSMGRTASGVKGIDLAEGEFVVGVTTSREGKLILAMTDKGFGKLSEAEGYRLTKRGAKGVTTIKATDKVGKLVAVRAVNGDEDLMAITSSGITIRIPLTEVRIIGRNTQGVKIINLEGRQKVASIAIVEHADEEAVDEENPNTDEVVENEENSTNE